ncbi:MAG: hypothetical protein A3H91_00150 [Gammaproteobacteria bacterium RIFCSPLOWO2_02_FULL_61_13]|nr:MAG: hypothetical protein A3H91_00150 [Gammaproteobacteria bacterium RIFCSPLOWO2_02_FULL_61_13]
MTTLVATSVVRGSHQGESTGGVYLIDLESGQARQTVDWNSPDINWEGRGADRGLRGIAFDGDLVYVAASDELFVYAPDFQPVASYRNPFLKHCHEICRWERRLFLTSTGLDSILGFDLDQKQFCWGLFIERYGTSYRARPFNPGATAGPPANNQLHINNVYCNAQGMYISGMRTGALLHFNGRTIAPRATLPHGTHNARPYRDGILFNDTQADVVRLVSPTEDRFFPVPRYDPAELTHTDLGDDRVARQAFGRGLCLLDDGVIAAGSSPSTVSVHDLNQSRTTLTVNLTKDIRNGIHGLAVWPFQRRLSTR